MSLDLLFCLLCASVVNSSPLDAGRAALGEGFHLLQLGHRHVTGERGQQRPVGPAEAKFLRRAVDSRPSQSAYALVDHLEHDDPIVQRFESWARARLARGFSLDEAAKAVGASKRTLARRMQDVLGKSPLSYFQSLRVERAVHLLKTGDASVEQIAARVGYTDGATLRALLRRQLNVGVKEIRKSGVVR